jgi:hypothetical protein
LWFEVCRRQRFRRRDDTHEPCVSRNIQPILACFSSNCACFQRGHRCPNITPPARPNMLRITRRTCDQNATVRKRWPHVSRCQTMEEYDE